MAYLVTPNSLGSDYLKRIPIPTAPYAEEPDMFAAGEGKESKTES